MSRLWVALLVFLGTFPLVPRLARGDASVSRVVDLRVFGLEKTDLGWLKSYLGLNLPLPFSKVDPKSIETKLLTTSVFSMVHAELAAMPDAPTDYYLTIKVTEKWTTIPVIRAVVGGGTPLKVAGIYDTHAFGSLWTLGLEARQYGNAAPGGVVWARAPRWFEGFHVLGLELWRDSRERVLYDRDGSSAWRFSSRATLARLLFLAPLFAVSNEARVWQWGFDIRISGQAPVAYKALKAMPEDFNSRIYLNSEISTVVKALGTIALDNIWINNLANDGLRVVFLAGPISDGKATYPLLEGEAFLFKELATDLEIATHVFLGATKDRSLNSQYFLGGLDSVRGLPDGLLYGNKAFYTNLELRSVFHRQRYAWFQGALFSDFGSAGSEWDRLLADARTTAGIGLRIAIPQVNRLMLRLDYAVSLDQPRQQGLNFGMNQFFQPHKPL